ncbi:MAG: hypothetical protein CVT66_11855 [Actinobacteria bacterium HGW-Actinobacteria-6]|jgi:hypothetical protein|nr:MAG: hypothetical protein CVT66_11855 [Actinobacteria bacterium HGW-Actinobacteria-6]
MADAISPYAYVANSPTNFVDPMGWLASDPVRLAQLSGLSKYWGAIGETMTDAGNGLYNSLPSQQSVQNFLDKSQTALDYAGLAAQGPLEVVAPFIDAASAGVSLLRGDYAGAGLSGLGAIPVIGSIANAAKVGRGIDNAADAAKGVGARVEAVHGALDPIAAGRRTTAALDTVEGTRVLAAGGRDLSPAQRALMVPGEVGAKLPGAHAEVTALQHAAQNGLTPAEMAVSRTICPTCRAAIEQSGGQLTSPTTAIWPR